MALTGFLVNMGAGNATVCADSAANAILALGARFPYVAGSQPLLCSLDSSVFSAPNIFSNSVTCHDLTGNGQWTYTHALTLMSCDPVSWPLGVTPLDAATAGAFWMFAVTMIVGLWIVSKNSGVILRMIEGWRR